MRGHPLVKQCEAQTLTGAVTEAATRLRVLCELSETLRRSRAGYDITLDTSLRDDLKADLVTVAEIVDEVEARLGVRLARLAPQDVDRVGDLVEQLVDASGRQRCL